MKTILKLSLVLALMIIFVKADSQSCMSSVIKYSGPKNTTQLTALLNTTDTTTYPLIVALTSAQKSSLETYMAFSTAGMPIGMSGSDSSIAALYTDTASCESLFSEILNQAVFVHSYGHGPTITSITMSQFQAMTDGGTVYSGGCSWCYNCSYPFQGSGSTCCYVCTNCGGCCDEIVLISTTSGIGVYKVTQ